MAERKCNKNPGPGPGAYLLPSTVGFRLHDSTRERQPAYTMKWRPEMQDKSLGPGPNFMVDNCNRFGRTTSPSYTMAPQLKPLTAFETPGPGQYCPEKHPDKTAAFSILQRLTTKKGMETPAPNAYTLPSCLNGTIRHLGMRLDNLSKDCSPGPARYSAPRLEVSRWRQPHYSMAARAKQANPFQTPGPGAYLPTFNTHRSAPQFSFGFKHTDCEITPLTDEDKYPPGCP